METLRKGFQDYRGVVLLKRVIMEWRMLAEFHLNEADLFRRQVRYAMYMFRMRLLAEKYDIPEWPKPREQL